MSFSWAAFSRREVKRKATNLHTCRVTRVGINVTNFFTLLGHHGRRWRKLFHQAPWFTKDLTSSSRSKGLGAVAVESAKHAATSVKEKQGLFETFPWLLIKGSKPHWFRHFRIFYAAKIGCFPQKTPSQRPLNSAPHKMQLSMKLHPHFCAKAKSV